MVFTIASILIHDEVDYTMIGSTKAAHWTTSRPWSSWLSIPVTVLFLEDLERSPTSDPARPPLAPLFTNEPCLALEAWATWVVDGPLRNFNRILGTWHLIGLICLQSLVQILRVVTLTVHKVKSRVIRDV